MPVVYNLVHKTFNNVYSRYDRKTRPPLNMRRTWWNDSQHIQLAHLQLLKQKSEEAWNNESYSPFATIMRIAYRSVLI